MTRDHLLGWYQRMRPLGPATRPITAPVLDTSVADFERGDHIAASEEPMLPDGINESGPGEYEAECCCCGEWRPIYCDLSDIPETGYEHYCGGSPRCCP